ncbi:putative quinol monooxygenase [Streptomyces sp. NPDC021093]|uniref:putative quinol monooxygenase n=1 Tax=Streptomyces sp. NPDC021093 TaxID=3365112 RepID=UPI0037BD9329
MSSHGAVTVLIEIHAKDGQEEEARERLSHAIRTSEKPGLLSSTEYEDLNDPGAFYAVQVWENAEAFRAHMEFAAETGMGEAIRVLRVPPRTVVLRTVD